MLKTAAATSSLVEMLTELNQRNPQVASRLIEPLIRLKRYDEKRQALMRAALEQLKGLENLSGDLFEENPVRRWRNGGKIPGCALAYRGYSAVRFGSPAERSAGRGRWLAMTKQTRRTLAVAAFHHPIQHLCLQLGQLRRTGGAAVAQSTFKSRPIFFSSINGTRSAMATASLTSCVTSRTVKPCSCHRRRSAPASPDG